MTAYVAFGALSSLHAPRNFFVRHEFRHRIFLIHNFAFFNVAFNPSPFKESIKLLVPDSEALNGGFRLHSTSRSDYLAAVGYSEASSSRNRIVESKNEKKKNKQVSRVGFFADSAASARPKNSKAARRFYNEHIREPQRLSKVLAAAGVASRRSCEELIFEGLVTVNGIVCTIPQTRVDLLRDSIYVKGNCLSKKLPPKLYFALNKPKGYICSHGEVSKSVLSLFDDYMKGWDKRNPGLPKPRLFTVGRLDVATSGLIIVTNDGDFAQKLAHPSSNLEKEYIATIDGLIHRRNLVAISEGTYVEGTLCIPDSVELLTAKHDDTSRPRLRIVVHDGKNHEVREIVKNAGLQLYSLKRVRIGGFRLPWDVGFGKYIELKQGDIKLLESKI